MKQYLRLKIIKRVNPMILLEHKYGFIIRKLRKKLYYLLTVRKNKLNDLELKLTHR